MEKDKIIFKGSHPDSLYRVATDSDIGRGTAMRVCRVLRWPIALFIICIALGAFVYFLVPNNLNSEINAVNATNWEDSVAVAQTHNNLKKQDGRRSDPNYEERNKTPPSGRGTKTPEIDFYEAETDTTYDLTTILDTVTENIFKRKLPAPPVFPSHINPEIQYGNERADLDKLRTPKLLDEIQNTATSESTLKPHITHQPEKPLAIYFQDGSPMPSSTESVTAKDHFGGEEPSNGLTGFLDRGVDQIVDSKKNAPGIDYREPAKVYSINARTNERYASSELPPIVQEFYSRPLVRDVKFTSGHSKMFGISVEEAEHMKATTQHSLYNTRVSPTLPTWRDKDDATTKIYPDGLHNLDVQQCRSTSAPLCRGVLPYDLAGPPATVGRTEVASLLHQMEYLVHTNCSERSVHYVCALLEPECSPQPNAPKLPCYNFCKAIVDSCDGYIPTELSAVFDCNQYSSNNCASPRSPCMARELACGDGTCIPRDWVCDGTRDCPTGEDEAKCSFCEQDDYRCLSGMCISKRAVCDGYPDCPRGDDEFEGLCRDHRPQARGLADLGHGDLGEESAGSAPAPSIRKPNRVSNGRKSVGGNTQLGESDSSKEILMTSDSNNSLRRNFTRRPSASRLSPYARPKPKETTSQPETFTTTALPETTKKPAMKRNSRPKPKPVAKSDKESAEDINFKDLEFDRDEKEKDKVEEITKKPSMIDISIVPGVPANKDDTKNKKIELNIDGAVMLKDAARAYESLDSIEVNRTKTDKSDENMYNSAHASPCPAGELRCVDGRCIALAQLCDGTIDCSDHADEDNCFT